MTVPGRARSYTFCLSLLALAGCGFNADDPWIDGPVVMLEEAPPPIHGGTLVVSRDGSQALLADPHRSRVVAVDLATREVRTLQLAHGLELGRLAEDGAGHVHVVARRAGVVIEIDTATMTEVARHSPCAAPRGIAWQAEGDRLHVACADGSLVTLGPTREEERRVFVAADLRDVVVADDGLLVSRFRSAETFLVLEGGEVSVPHAMPDAMLTSSASAALRQQYTPNAAIRMVSSEAGTFVVHQRARVGREAVTTATSASAYSYSSRSSSDGVATWTDPCENAVAHATVTALGVDGAAMNVGMPLRRGVTPVDVAVSTEGRLAVAFAGDLGGTYSTGPQVVLATATSATVGGSTTCFPGEVQNGLPGQVIAVAFARERLLSLTRSPSMLLVEGEDPIALGGASVTDTGHDLFHLDLGGTIACASCHPGGADDGHVWEFVATGAVRTLSLEGVVGHGPYHRAGNMRTFGALMTALEPQMDAPPLGEARTEAIERWLSSVPLPPSAVSRAPERVAMGETVFEREACASCHTGALGSDRVIHGVESGRFVTAALAGLAGRAPYLHDGSAPSLESAVSTHAGGVGLSLEERAALVAYLETR